MLSNITQELSTIEISPEVMQQLDIGQIYQSFRNNYYKLDNLKKFRTEYERKNAITRWWHNDKLRDAQLDSAEVQAEFSKTIGQLMVLSIEQSKKLVAQQNLLNNQQSKLQEQANTIARQTSDLQVQHQTLAEHSKTIDAQHAQLEQQQTELKKVMVAYFDLKGLDEDRLRRLVEIGKKAAAIEKEVQATKNEVLHTFENHKQKLYEELEQRLKAHQRETLQNINKNAQVFKESQVAMETKQQEKNLALDSSFVNLSMQLAVQGEQASNALTSLKNAISFDMQVAQKKTTETIAQLEIIRKAEQKAMEESITQNLQTLQESQSTFAATQQEKNFALDSSFVNLSAQLTLQASENQEKRQYLEETLHVQAEQINKAIISLKSEINSDIQAVQQKTTETIAQLEVTRKAEQKAIEEYITQNLQTLQESQSTFVATQQEKNFALDSSLVNLSAKSEIAKKSYANMAKHIKRLNYFIVGLSMTTLGTFGILIHIAKG